MLLRVNSIILVKKILWISINVKNPQYSFENVPHEAKENVSRLKNASGGTKQGALPQAGGVAEAVATSVLKNTEGFIIWVNK